ncbi:MAG: pyridoxamine 5'-phosphate oxidase family protein [Aestuariivirga sp.]|nr:pyridoxamine 5'-phosphate oxidase family protein [Aestuariivirga sp.]
MHIEELTRKASMDFLAGSRLGHLACANNGQPYVTPCYFAYHDQCIYGFSTAGQKIEWLRTNPLACLQVDEIASFQEWTSVVVLGRYEELTKTGKSQEARELAYKLLHQHEFWWEPGYTRTVLHGEVRPLNPVYYRLSIDEITGHKATPN